MDTPETRQAPARNDSPNATEVAIASTTTRIAGKSSLLAILLVTLTFVAYMPAWHSGFIWDDDDHLTANPVMTAPHGLRMIWSSLTYSRYYPLTLTTFWLERQLWGLNPMPYHLVNIAIHAINAILIVLVLGRLRVRGRWLAAFLWVLHPVNVESVAWITELKNTQSEFFFLLSLLCFLAYDAREKVYSYFLALLFAFAAMLSKPSTVILPVVLLLCVWWMRRRWQVVDILRMIPFFGLSCWLSTRTITEQRMAILSAGTTEWSLSIAERFVIAGKAIWFYAVKLLCPVKLAFVYPLWQIEAKSFLSWLPLAGVIAAGAIFSVHRDKRWAQSCLFGGGFFLLALLPILGFFDVFYFRYSFVADHFQYLASIGLIALVASAATTMCVQAGAIQRIGRMASITAVSLLCVLTWQQARGYQDNETLWRHSLRNNPDAFLAQNNLGGTLFQKAQVEDIGRRHQDALRDYEESLAHIKLALRLKPDRPDGYLNVAVGLVKLGRPQEAIEYYERALRIKPNSSEARYGFGITLTRLGKLSEAIKQFEEASLLRPDWVEAHNNLGMALSRVGKMQDAVWHYEQALRISPNLAITHDNLANALMGLGKVQEAAQHFEQALQISSALASTQDDPKDALLRLIRGQVPISHFEQAEQFIPDLASTHENLGNALLLLGKRQEAISHFKQAVQIRPNYAGAQNSLAWILATDGDDRLRNPVLAIQLAEHACDLTQRHDPNLLDTLAAAYAAQGRFTDSIRTGKEALDLAQARGQSRLANQIQGRLELYSAACPYYEYPTATASP